VIVAGRTQGERAAAGKGREPNRAVCVVRPVRVFLSILGAALVVVGLPLFWTPIPFGLLLIAAGLALLLSSSPAFQAWLRRRRARHRELDDVVRRAERTSPEQIRETLEKTDP